MQLEELARVLWHSSTDYDYCCSTSEDQKLFILSTDGVHIFSFLRKPICIPFKFQECVYVQSDKYLQDFLNYNCEDEALVLEREHVIAMRLDSHIMPSGKETLLEHSVFARWSPSGLFKQPRCILASISRTGFVDISLGDVNDWKSICNLTSLLLKKISIPRLETITNPGEKLKQFKKFSCTILASALCWSTLLVESCGSTFCNLFVSHFDGSMTAWKVHSKDPLEITFGFREKITMYTANSIHYFEYKDEKSDTVKKLNESFNNFLIIGHKEGVIELVEIINNPNLQIGRKIALWSEEDKLRVSYISHMYCNGKNLILAAKERYLFVFWIDVNGCKLSETVCVIGNFKITGVEHCSDDSLIVTCINGATWTVNISFEEDKLIVKKTKHAEIPLVKDKWIKGVFKSRNSAYFGLVYIVNDLGSSTTLNEISLYGNTMQICKEFRKLKSLRNSWDYFDAVWFFCIGKKCNLFEYIPEISSFDEAPVHILQVYYWILQLAKNYKEQSYEHFQNKLPTFEVLREILFFKCTLHTAQRFVKDIEEEVVHNFPILESLLLIKQYLESAKTNFGWIKGDLSKSLEKVLAAICRLRLPSYLSCFWCGENLTGLVCSSNHLDQRCSITFLQLTEEDFLLCPQCDSVAKINIGNYAVCNFCDLDMLPSLGSLLQS